MVAAMRLSAMLGNEDLSERLIGILEHIGLPTELKYGREDIYRSLLSDKKKFGATVNFILVREPGRAEITPIGAEKLHEYVPETVREGETWVPPGETQSKYPFSASRTAPASAWSSTVFRPAWRMTRLSCCARWSAAHRPQQAVHRAEGSRQAGDPVRHL